jgi:hypothetical protein
MRGPRYFVLVAVVVFASFGVSGDEHERAAGNGLSWLRSPTVVAPPGLPHDRILMGRIRNRSSQAVELNADEVRVLDQRRRPLRGTNARYVSSWVHGLYGASGGRDDIGPSEHRRLGLVRTLQPGASAPVVVAWRGKGGPLKAAAISAAGTRLPIPPARGGAICGWLGLRL